MTMCDESGRRGKMDADLDAMSRNELIAEVKRFRDAIRAHRDTTGHNLCWQSPTLGRAAGKAQS